MVFVCVQMQRKDRQPETKLLSGKKAALAGEPANVLKLTAVNYCKLSREFPSSLIRVFPQEGHPLDRGVFHDECFSENLGTQCLMSCQNSPIPITTFLISQFVLRRAN